MPKIALSWRTVVGVGKFQIAYTLESKGLEPLSVMEQSKRITSDIPKMHFSVLINIPKSYNLVKTCRRFSSLAQSSFENTKLSSKQPGNLVHKHLKGLACIPKSVRVTVLHCLHSHVFCNVKLCNETLLQIVFLDNNINEGGLTKHDTCHQVKQRLLS